MGKRLLLAVLLAPSGAGAARAQGVHEACREELKACPRAETSRDRLRCLEPRRGGLSAGCAAAIERERAEGALFREDCKAEIGAACLNLEGHALIECLEALGDKLSPSCAARLEKLRSGHRAVHERIAAACKDDAQKLCVGVPSGGIGACLRAVGARLSKECHDALK